MKNRKFFRKRNLILLLSLLLAVIVAGFFIQKHPAETIVVLIVFAVHLPCIPIHHHVKKRNQERLSILKTEPH